VGSVAAAELYRYQNEAGITVVDWVIPAAYVSSGYEILNESGQVVRVVPPAKMDTDFERDAAAARAQDVEAVAQAARLERDTFLLRRYSTIQDIEAARYRPLC
jgi:transposase